MLDGSPATFEPKARLINHIRPQELLKDSGRSVPKALEAGFGGESVQLTVSYHAKPTDLLPEKRRRPAPFVDCSKKIPRITRNSISGSHSSILPLVPIRP